MHCSSPTRYCRKSVRLPPSAQETVAMEAICMSKCSKEMQFYETRDAINMTASLQ